MSNFNIIQMPRSSSVFPAGTIRRLLFRAPKKRSSISEGVKRILDIIISMSFILCFLPLFAILILLTALDGGPPFYAQRRIGLGGQAFKCWKFRTMVPDADKRLGALLAANEAARREYETYWKLKDDPRITRLGRLMRRYSLDELPQLVNVLLGDMSIVGPRPRSEKEMQFFQANLPEFSQGYTAVKPGLTGLWQVCGRNHLSLETKASLDAHYSKHWSITGDLVIIAVTFPAVLRGDGAF